ncbi:hypothetical protein [Litorisediminicola beolgyonensis]|uniref:Uncharacterized protein n=1 Tax=Litorisediminicola beolgyonensis TaxID=1173614 RepID=A0ABW3ZED9_9RHOB
MEAFRDAQRLHCRSKKEHDLKNHVQIISSACRLLTRRGVKDPLLAEIERHADEVVRIFEEISVGRPEFPEAQIVAVASGGSRR